MKKQHLGEYVLLVPSMLCKSKWPSLQVWQFSVCDTAYMWGFSKIVRTQKKTFGCFTPSDMCSSSCYLWGGHWGHLLFWITRVIRCFLDVFPCLFFLILVTSPAVCKIPVTSKKKTSLTTWNLPVLHGSSDWWILPTQTPIYAIPKTL